MNTGRLAQIPDNRLAMRLLRDMDRAAHEAIAEEAQIRVLGGVHMGHRSRPLTIPETRSATAYQRAVEALDAMEDWGVAA